MNREQLNELRARAQRACDETTRVLREAKRNIKWSEELIARSAGLSAATSEEILELIKICKISARLVTERSSLVEQSACEFLIESGSNAIAFLQEKAEIESGLGHEFAADIWSEIADAAERIWREAA